MESKKIEQRNHVTWLETYKDDSKRQSVRAWSIFEEFLGDKTEGWIFENRTVEDWGQHLVDFRRYLSKRPLERGRGTLSDNTTRTITGLIRGYLLHIGCVLQLTGIQKQELTKIESVPRFDYPFNLKVKAKLLMIADAMEEYVLSTGISFGLRTRDFLGVTRGMLEPLLNNELPIQLEVQTKKKGVKAHPFVDRDSFTAIKRRLEEMNNEGLTSSNSKMCDLTEFEVNDLLKNLFKKANIDLGIFRIRFHCLRKFICDNLASVCSEDKWKHFVGKSASSPYVTAEGREAYKRVMELTCLNGDQGANEQLLGKQLKLRDTEIEILKDEIGRLTESQDNNRKAIASINKDYKEFVNIVEPFLHGELTKVKERLKERGDK